MIELEHRNEMRFAAAAARDSGFASITLNPEHAIELIDRIATLERELAERTAELEREHARLEAERALVEEYIARLTTLRAERNAAEADRDEAHAQLAEARRELEALQDAAAHFAHMFETADIEPARELADAGVACREMCTLIPRKWRMPPAPPQPAAPSERAPVEPDDDAPLLVADLADWWDARRRAQGRPDASRCAAELRRALASTRDAADEERQR